MKDIIIVGAGLSGLTAANYLQQAGVDFSIVESTDRVGGRVKTDLVDGYRLDHGFQVLLTAYPETQTLLDYEKLNLKEFVPGALLLQKDGTQDRIGDPLRDLSSLFPTLMASVGGIGNKIKILLLKMRLAGKSIDEIFQQENKTTLAVLKEDYGFSDKIIERFFAPFFSGIFLEKELVTNRRMFDFTFKMFGEGAAAVPDLGMEEIPKQLAGNLPKDRIRLNSKVQQITKEGVILESGELLAANKILLASQATSLVKEYLPQTKTKHVSTTHIHFTAASAPFDKGIIALNTKKASLVNNICVINKVAPSYAPAGNHLISLSIVGNKAFQEKELISKVKAEMKAHLGAEVAAWEHLHTRHINYALPDQKSVHHELNSDALKIKDNLYVCGDFLLNGSINAAMKTGRLAAEKMISEINGGV